jgi:hypothetical protein
VTDLGPKLKSGTAPTRKRRRSARAPDVAAAPVETRKRRRSVARDVLERPTKRTRSAPTAAPDLGVDARGNRVEATLYESLLAEAILKAPEQWSSSCDLVNQRIAAFLDEHEAAPAVQRYLARPRQREGHEKLARKELELGEVFSLHKRFFEKAVARAQGLSVSTPPPPSRGPRSLAEMCQLQLRATPSLVAALRAKARSPALFDDAVRGRVKLPANDGLRRRQHGILAHGSTTPAGLETDAKPWRAAIDRCARDPASPFVQAGERADVPFVAGPSGTMSHVIPGVLTALAPVPARVVREYLMAYGAVLVRRGHHALRELAVVAETLGFGPREKRASAAGSDDARHDYYRQFLTEGFIESAAYRDFVTTWPAQRAAFAERSAHAAQGTNP